MKKKKEEYLTFTPLTVVIFVVVCCIMMVLLYFFYKWLVYVMIAIFCIASAMSLYNCLAALIRKIPYGQCRIVCRGKSTEVRLIFLSALCVAVVVVWAVFRNEDRWAWILQDILGIAFCLNLIKTLKLPNFKSCVILLGLLLLYDVFFVFITPFITKNGESIMVEVAAGPFGNNEKLPVVIRVPKLIYFSVMSVCLMPVSILGFGDIIVPGKCECGKCTCYPPGDQRVYGKTCECDNRRCEDLDGVVCGGHGTCSCGRCVCETGWFGRLCQHPRMCNLTEEQSKSLCESADGELCSGKGSCHCGKCICSAEEWYISGEFCDCDDRDCDKHEGLICTGNGICNCGNCECWDGWNGNACEIWLGTEYP